MKRVIAIFFFLSFGSLLFSQDYSYLMKIWNIGYPNSTVTFLEDTVIVSTPPFDQFGAIRSVSNVCNSMGEYLFATNGTLIIDSFFHVIENGDSLTDDEFLDAMGAGGTAGFQGTLILPKKDNLWYAFNYSISDSVWNIMPGGKFPNRLYYSIVDMNANNGAGKVISKKKVAYAGNMGDSRMTGTRHGNGRDWWLVVHGYNNNEYYKFLVTPDTVMGPFVQAIGDTMLEPDAVGQAKFSEDGTLYASGTLNSNIVVLDFDRCSGEFSNPRSIKYYPDPPYICNNGTTNCSGIYGLSFSPSKRFLYANTMSYIHQIDLENPNPDSTRVLLATYDSTWSDWGPFMHQYLMPNGQIFIGVAASNNIGDKASVIHYPDSLGLSCGFERESFHIPGCLGVKLISNHINYALNGNGMCDTPVVVREVEREDEYAYFVQNPVHNSTSLLYNINKDKTSILEITDLNGRLVKKVILNSRNNQQEINFENLNTGLYLYNVFSVNELVGKGKLILY